MNCVNNMGSGSSSTYWTLCSISEVSVTPLNSYFSGCNSCRIGREIPRILWKLKVHYHAMLVHNWTLLWPRWIQFKYFYIISLRFTFIPPPLHGCFPFRFPNQFFYKDRFSEAYIPSYSKIDRQKEKYIFLQVHVAHFSKWFGKGGYLLHQ